VWSATTSIKKNVKKQSFFVTKMTISQWIMAVGTCDLRVLVRGDVLYKMLVLDFSLGPSKIFSAPLIVYFSFQARCVFGVFILRNDFGGSTTTMHSGTKRHSEPNCSCQILL